MYYEQTAWRNYVADGVKILTGNTSGSQERYQITARFRDYITPKAPQKEQTAEQIIEHLRRAFEDENT